MTARPAIHFAEQYRAPGDYLYVLVDGLAECDQEHPLSIPSLTQTLGESAIARVLRPDLAHTPEACPALVQLAAPGETPAARYLELGAHYALDDLTRNKRYVCGWLLSPQPLAAIADHLVAQCHATAPGRGRTLSPWYEPIRLELLIAALRSQIAEVLGLISAWLCPTSWGSFTVLRGSTVPQQWELPPLARDTQHLAPLISDFLGVWRHALKRPPRYAPWRWKGTSLLPPQAGTHAFRLVRDARDRKLSDSHDIISLCLHRVFIHPHLPQHPDIQRDIAQAAAGNLSLQARFNAYDDAAWARIATSLPRAENYS